MRIALFFRALTFLAEGRVLEAGGRWYGLGVRWGWYCVISATVDSAVTDGVRTTLVSGAIANSYNTIIMGRREQSG